ncbi:hypothetical protein [Streptomyces sp. NPDC047990]
MKVATALGLLLVLVLWAWAWTSAPCGTWHFAKAGETPARCLMR